MNAIEPAGRTKPAGAPIPDAAQAFGPDAIHALHAGTVGKLEELRCRGLRDARGPAWYSSRFHIVLPQTGAFVWHVNRDEVLVDANHVLFVTGEHESAFSHPVGHECSLVLTPSPSIAAQLLRGRAADRGAVDRAQWHTVGFKWQAMARRLREAAVNDDDPLTLDEKLLAMMEALIVAEPGSVDIGGMARRTLDRARAYLHASFTGPVTLDQVARACGVSPVYLTGLFRRAEGVPLHQYLLKLRLSAALVELPRCEDITGLALDLGFSSHSHFSATFRSRFGISPSAFRLECGVRATPADRATERPSLRPNTSAAPAKLLCAARGGSLQ